MVSCIIRLTKILIKYALEKLAKQINSPNHNAKGTIFTKGKFVFFTKGFITKIKILKSKF